MSSTSPTDVGWNATPPLCTLTTQRWCVWSTVSVYWNKHILPQLTKNNPFSLAPQMACVGSESGESGASLKPTWHEQTLDSDITVFSHSDSLYLLLPCCTRKWVTAVRLSLTWQHLTCKAGIRSDQPECPAVKKSKMQLKTYKHKMLKAA